MQTLQLPKLLFLVEDEELVRDMLEMAFTEAGFDVFLASSGKQALAELETNASRFKAIVTDIRLGAGPDGWDVVQRARELVPTMPIVYMTGDSAHDWASKGVPKSVIIPKPFAPAQIITAVATLVNEALQTG
jgi:DNA-binding NtrC family response regulator